jgi:hypothetical protein
VLALAAVALVACGLAPVQAGEMIRAQVTYVTGSSVYLSAGHEDGLTLGRPIVIRRGDEVVATAEVTELSTHRASCRIVDRLLDPMVGDTATFEREEVVPAVVPTEGQPTTVAPARRPGGGGVHGRVGLRFLWVDDGADANAGYSQPALDLRLDGQSLGGSPWGFSIDARSRHTFRTTSGGLDDDDTRTRVYRAAVTRRGIDDPFTVTAGRQYTPSLAAISIFDGISV